LKTIQKTYKWLAALLLLIAMGMAFTFWSYHQIEEASDHRRNSRDVIEAADGVLSDLKDAETSQRGYSLTGDEAYLQPYLVVRDGMKVHLTRLRQLTTSTAA
jgi:CHASE3 domain sensor protein